MKLLMPVSEAYTDHVRRLSYDYRVRIANEGWSIHIARGYCSDGASIPRLLWRIVGHPWQGRSEPAAWCHDILYQTRAVPRHVADVAFRRLLRANGIGAIKAWAMYRGVRLGGWRAYRRGTEADAECARQYLEIVNLDKLLEIVK